MGSYPGYRQNTKRVMQDAERIVERLRDIGTTLAVVKAEYRCSYTTLYKAIFSKISREEWRNIAHQKLARGGIKTRFQNGHPTWNKDLKGIHLSPATEFKKGHLPTKYKPIRTIYVVRDHRGKPYRWIKLSDKGGWQDRRMPYARYLWQQEHGPIPVGMLVIHYDGNTLNNDPGNFILVDRASNAAHQLATNPKHLRKFRRGALNALINHWANYRKAEMRGTTLTWYQCTGCGEDYLELPTPPCKKCGHLVFEMIEQPIAFARQRAEVSVEASSRLCLNRQSSIDNHKS